jgi:peptidoglycan/xylan/chitin deacetylase (PgdA/CDA1 family)
VSGFSRTSHHAAILAYHRVADLTPDSHALCTPPAEFREQMAYLRANFLPIGLEDLVQAAASGRIPEGAVAVTLDDGYLDALTIASPILVDLGVPATFFVNTDRLSEEHERGWDVLERIFVSDTDALERLNRIMWPLDARARQDLVESVLTWSGVDRAPRPTHRVLTGEEIRALAGRPGHTIGAHTTHHLALTTQSGDVKRREVFENKASLEQLLGRPVRLFAYPYGDFDAETRTIVRDAGFLAAVTVEAGRVSAGANRLLLPRYEIATPSAFLRVARKTEAL